ncbi:hypothetical protein A3Q40_03116 [Rhodococcus sp. PBTS 1]|nr:hypothetical protein A3Q40_03116 [Rhodococcus sp. PBTS 1]
MRTRAFDSAFQQLGLATKVFFPRSSTPSPLTGGPRHESRIRGVASRARDLKRSLIPMPTALGARNAEVSKAISDTDHVTLLHTAVISQAPLARRFAGPHWLDFMDQWSSFAQREAIARVGLSRRTAMMQSAWLRVQERKWSSRASLVTAAGWQDSVSMRRSGIPALWLPTPISDELFEKDWVAGTGGRVAGMVGNFNYWPNRDAYEVLIECWLPEMRRQGWSLKVCGIGSNLLAPVSGVTLMGELPDLDEFFESIDMTVAPIRLGGGVKVKVIESLARGVPVLTSDRGLEGFSPELRGLAVAAPLTPLRLDLCEMLEAQRDLDRLPLDDFRYSTFSAKIGDLYSSIEGET